jgi:hypothetical protein
MKLLRLTGKDYFPLSLFVFVVLLALPHPE